MRCPHGSDEEAAGVVLVDGVGGGGGVPGRGAGAGAGAASLAQGPERRVPRVQGLVPRRAVVPDAGLHRELLLGDARDRRRSVPEDPQRHAQGEAQVLGLQPGAAELGGRHPVVAHGLRGAVPLPRGAAAQEDDRDGRELEVSGPEISKLQGSLAHEL